MYLYIYLTSSHFVVNCFIYIYVYIDTHSLLTLICSKGVNRNAASISLCVMESCKSHSHNLYTLTYQVTIVGHDNGRYNPPNK